MDYRTGEVCRDMRGTGGAVGGLGMEEWAGARVGRIMTGLSVNMEEAATRVGRARLGGALGSWKD